jgi:hypothetical protein
MKRKIIIEAEVESNDAISLIIEDLMAELLCCWHDFSFKIREASDETN